MHPASHPWPLEGPPPPPSLIYTLLSIYLTELLRMAMRDGESERNFDFHIDFPVCLPDGRLGAEEEDEMISVGKFTSKQTPGKRSPIASSSYFSFSFP